jgi:hypothetical protein
MRTLRSISSATWARQPLSHLWRLHEHAGAYFVPPRMTLVRTTTHFGRLEYRHGPLALLLTVAFDNTSAQPIGLQSLAIKSHGSWYQPIYFLGDRVHLWYEQGQHDLHLPRAQNIITAPYIPPSAAVQRCALFRLPDMWDRWPTHLRVTAKATFVHRRSKSLIVNLTNPT